MGLKKRDQLTIDDLSLNTKEQHTAKRSETTSFSFGRESIRSMDASTAIDTKREIVDRVYSCDSGRKKWEGNELLFLVQFFLERHCVRTF